MNKQQLDSQKLQRQMEAEPPAVGTLYQKLLVHETLHLVAPAMASAYLALTRLFLAGGTLYICGNGGSMADAIHISGELLKSFIRQRPLPIDVKSRLFVEPDGAALANSLQSGLRVHVLGLNPALLSAAANDLPLEGIAYAQELVALARPGDTLLAISTSGKARNVHLAVSTARALQMTTIGMTGAEPNPLADRVNIAIVVPEKETFRVQELHQVLYHQLCLMLEARFY